MTPSDSAVELARKAHRTLEPLHVIGYFAPEPGERIAALGIKGGMRVYFAARSAALGRVPADVVVATFYNFNPTSVAKAIPSVWDVTTPEAVIAARYDGVDAAYRRLLGDDVLASDEMAEAAALAREATTALTPLGRPLFASHHSLAWPDPAHLQLFHAQTLLREHRGDGHVAAVMLAGLDAVEALVTHEVYGGGLPKALTLATRGWSEHEWQAAAQRLRDRGLLDADGAFTTDGTAQREWVEQLTDEAAAAPYRHLGPDRTERLRSLARPWSKLFAAELAGPSR